MYEIQDDGTTTTTRIYYSITGMRVAMEEDDGTTQTVYYFINDHLSSASVVTDASGTLLSENRYTPFGEVRDLPASMSTDDPITETDFGYTGQRNLGGIGLMDYNARFYSPSLRRFIQPDSIVPSLGNPQGLDRYSYTSNNPVKYIDPSGHMVEQDIGYGGSRRPQDDGDDDPLPYGDCSKNSYACRAPNPNRDKFAQLEAAANDILVEYGHCDGCDNSNADDLEGMAQIVEAAADIYEDDLLGFLNGLTKVFNGVPYAESYTLPVAGFLNFCNGVGRDPSDDCGNTYYFGDEGFRDEFKDGHNQVFHVWPYIASVVSPRRDWGRQVGSFGNWAHETWLGDSTQMSQADYDLAVVGMDIGELWYETSLDPYELADMIREYLGE